VYSQAQLAPVTHNILPSHSSTKQAFPAASREAMPVRAPAAFVSFKFGNGGRKRTVESSSAFLRASGGKDGQTAVDIFVLL
jgi:hypothetical protein